MIICQNCFVTLTLYAIEKRGDIMENSLNDIHFLIDYRVDESNYGFHNPNIIYACHKLNDIYYTYCLARINLEFYHNENFGDFAQDERSIEFIRPQFLMSALNYYNVLIDLSWQMIWFYIRKDLNQTIPSTKIYESVAKECNEHTLDYYLTLAKEYKLKKYYIKEFFNTETTKNIREKWNFSKHRAIYHFEGMGYNPSRMMMSMNNYTVQLVSRKEMNSDVLIKELIDFDNEYFKYLTDLIKIIFPSDFTVNKNFMESIFNYHYTWKEQIEVINK